MQNASVATKSGKTAEGKVVRSLVGDAKPKLLDQLREALRARHYSRRTEQTYCLWVKRFILFHQVRHPADMAEPGLTPSLPTLPLKGG